MIPEQIRQSKNILIISVSCDLIDNLIALIYNWWSLYVRFYDEEHHREAIRSRPMLMAGVGRQVQSGCQVP